MRRVRFALICPPCLLLLLAMAAGPWTAPSRADDTHSPDPGARDTVTLLPSDPGSTPTTVRGSVLEYSGRVLMLRTSAGETSISAEKVARVETVYPRQFDQSLPLLLAGKSAEAIGLLQEALTVESRPWVQRAIRARLAIALQNAGRTVEAGNAFLQIAAEDPQTIHLEAMPLAWGSYAPNFERDRKAREWLESSSLHAQLMGASWLLSTADRSQALRVLTNLRQSNQPKLALLAESQIWQSKIVTATSDDVNQWTKQLESGLLRGAATAGPYLVIGKARRQLDQDTQAALWLMRPPILFPELRPVAAEALLLAARSMERGGQNEQAARLAREVVESYSDQPDRQEAEIILKRLASSGGN